MKENAESSKKVKLVFSENEVAIKRKL